MKNESTTQKTAGSETPMPTPYELSNLAIMAGQLLNSTHDVHGAGAIDFLWIDGKQFEPSAFKENIDQCIHIAMTVWKKSVKAIESRESPEAKTQLRELLRGIFTFSIEEWRGRLSEYKGLKREVDDALKAKLFPAKEVLRELYPTHQYNDHQRRKLTMGLPEFALLHDVPHWNGKVPRQNEIQGWVNCEHGLAAPDVNGYVARYFWEVAQVQKWLRDVGVGRKGRKKDRKVLS